MINIGEILLNLWESSGFARIFSGFVGDMTWQNVVMLIIGCVLLYLAIVKKFEPLLLTGIAYTMNRTFYQEGLAKYGIEVLVPDDEEKTEAYRG